MNDMQDIKQAVKAFEELSTEERTTFADLNKKIQIYDGEWSIHKGGDKNADGSIQMPYVQSDPLIWEFINFMQDKNLLPFFDWVKWHEGSELFTSTDENKYETLDLETALKLIYAAIRKERFSDGTIAWAFRTGGFTKLVNRLALLSEQR
jgi:hypothetical protein